jgi:hypothetical protein
MNDCGHASGFSSFIPCGPRSVTVSLEPVALAVAIVSGILVPTAIGAVFPWVLSINSKVAVIVEKLTVLAERIEQDFHEHQQMSHTLADHERRLDDHEHRLTVIEQWDSHQEPNQ